MSSSSKTYTKKDLIDKLSYKLDMNYDDSKIITDCVLESFKEFFINTSGKNRIEIRDFGVFNILSMKISEIKELSVTELNMVIVK